MAVKVDRISLLHCGSLHPTVQEGSVLETSELCQEFRCCKQVRQPGLVITVRWGGGGRESTLVFIWEQLAQGCLRAMSVHPNKS